MDDDVLPSDFLQHVRQTIAAYDDIRTGSDEVFDPRSPALRKLVEQIFFSGRFILTYYAVLGALVSACAVQNWYRKWKRQKNTSLTQEQKDSGTPSRSSNASSNTTLLPSEDNSVKDVDTEQTPLLQKQVLLQNIAKKGKPQVIRRLQAFLMFQPDPVPAFTSPTNHLPANSTTLVVLLLLAINLFYLFFHVPLTIPMLFAFADRAGRCFAVNLPILYILAAKTNQPLHFLTGWSYEGLNIFHRRLGEWMIAFAAIHGVSMMGVWYTLLRPLHFGLIRFLSNKTIFLGIFALVAYLAIYVSSTGWVRRLYYETFLGLHIVLQVLALALLFFHHPRSRVYVVVSLLIWVLDRIACRMFLSKRRLVATLQVASDQKTVLVFCDIPIKISRPGLKMDICHGWRAGQHVFITIPGLGWRHKLQAHPFTIASPAPPADMTEGCWPLQLTIRGQDGFSKEVLDFARLHQHCEVSIDGPYGSVEVLEAAQSADRVFLVAGGSGIAVTYPISWALQGSDTQSAIVSARTVYEKGVRKCGTKGLLFEDSDNPESCASVWVRQDSRADTWISYFPRRSSVVGARSAEGTGQDAVLNLVTSRFETGGVHSLRPDIRTELREWVERGSQKAERIVVVVSGPDALVRDVRNGAASLLLRGYDIDVHVEKFGW